MDYSSSYIPDEVSVIGIAFAIVCLAFTLIINIEDSYMDAHLKLSDIYRRLEKLETKVTELEHVDAASTSSDEED